MKRRRGLFLIFFFAGALAGILIAGSFAHAQEKPAGKPRNIVFILIDDLRFDGIGILNSFYQTPAIDDLARRGVLFENCFVTSSLCSPSRATILTGRYGHAHGILDNRTDLPDGVATFPCELQKAGYETALIGKWHMGGERDDPRPGFDRWVSFRGQGVYKNPVFNVDGTRTPREGYVTDLITDYADEFIRKPRAKPFFLYVSHKAVHHEFMPAPRHAGSYADRTYSRPSTMADTEENRKGKPNWVLAQRSSWHGVDGMYDDKFDYDEFVRGYAETMRSVDDSVSRIVQALRESGQLDSTLIIFTSDNGFQFGEHGLIDKRTMYEASIRVPLIASCHGLIAAGTRRKEMILNLDLAPTILEAAQAPAMSGVQGRSFYPMLKGENPPWRDSFLYEYFWERSFPQTPTVLGVRTDRYKLMKFHGIWDRLELYDLEKDPEEKNNLLGDAMIRHEAGPTDTAAVRLENPETTALFKEMLAKLATLLKETECAAEPNWRPGD